MSKRTAVPAAELIEPVCLRGAKRIHKMLMMQAMKTFNVVDRHDVFSTASRQQLPLSSVIVHLVSSQHRLSSSINTVAIIIRQHRRYLIHPYRLSSRHSVDGFLGKDKA
jgi:hypothetical protein